MRDALRRWAERYGHVPSSYDWSRTHARRRGEQALRRLDLDDWPAPATVAKLYGSWSRALADAFADPAAPVPPTRPPLEPAVRSLTREIAVRADAWMRRQTPSAVTSSTTMRCGRGPSVITIGSTATASRIIARSAGASASRKR